MFNKTSIYLLNKRDPDAIVYPSATGEPIRVTREDFPSEEAFLAFKAWSDEDFRKEDNGDVVEDKRRVSIDNILESALSVPSIDVVIEHHQLSIEKHKQDSAMVLQIKDKLTETQFRRLWMYLVDGMTIDEIGEKEGVSHQAISLSITTTIKKIKKYF